MPSEVRIIPVAGIPEVAAGDDVGRQICEAADDQGTSVEPGDVVVIAQKIVSKAEGRVVPAETRDDARAAAKREARRIVRESADHLIVETREGFICANAGVDMSNAAAGTATLLPKDSDASAQRIRKTIEARAGAPVAVIVSDTFSRPWRLGQTNVAIGSSGIAVLRSYKGQFDSAGRELVITEIAHIDELAGAAELVMKKLEGVPVAIVRGYEWEPAEGRARDIVRPVEQDLFR
jgi:coenzyme F420-0:L-glutamate ligase/coenzyme F420-1:gamma-L-glutamate ligase